MTDVVLDLADDGPAAPPRANGELVFDAPWQSRVFGVTAALVEQATFEWSDFQAALITQVAKVDHDSADTGEPASYWACWLEALSVVTHEAQLVATGQWSARCEDLAARPAGHDH